MKKLIIELKLLSCGYIDNDFFFPDRYGGGMSSAKAALESDTRVWPCIIMILIFFLFTCEFMFFYLHFTP